MASERADVENSTKRDVRPWTVMVYMAAGDSAEMDDYAVRDLREMQQGANEHVHVAVQIKRHWPEIPQRYVITGYGRQGSSERISSRRRMPKHTDMGDRETLTDFLEWSRQGMSGSPLHARSLGSLLRTWLRSRSRGSSPAA